VRHTHGKISSFSVFLHSPDYGALLSAITDNPSKLIHCKNSLAFDGDDTQALACFRLDEQPGLLDEGQHLRHKARGQVEEKASAAVGKGLAGPELKTLPPHKVRVSGTNHEPAEARGGKQRCH